MTEIREWVEKTFAGPGAGPGAKLFLELGSHRGEDTKWLSEIDGVSVVAFEPDPRNVSAAELPPHATIVHAAISDMDGVAPFILSESGWGREWTFSSSLRKPKNHLTKFPVTFGRTIQVRTMRLDTAHERLLAGRAIDFIWCDIQGAEGDMIKGGGRALENTHYLYTEYSNEELYEGQPNLEALLEMVPDFRILKLWDSDVLLVNTKWNARRAAA